MKYRALFLCVLLVRNLCSFLVDQSDVSEPSSAQKLIFAINHRNYYLFMYVLLQCEMQNEVVDVTDMLNLLGEQWHADNLRARWAWLTAVGGISGAGFFGNNSTQVSTGIFGAALLLTICMRPIVQTSEDFYYVAAGRLCQSAIAAIDKERLTSYACELVQLAMNNSFFEPIVDGIFVNGEPFDSAVLENLA